jgi:hypothetical protein
VKTEPSQPRNSNVRIACVTARGAATTFREPLHCIGCIGALGDGRNEDA